MGEFLHDPCELKESLKFIILFSILEKIENRHDSEGIWRGLSSVEVAGIPLQPRQMHFEDEVLGQGHEYE